MNTLTKILLGVAAAMLLVFVAIIVTVTVVFEPNDYRPYLVRAVESATGRDFALEGDLGLKLLPCCAVSLRSATLGNPEGFPSKPFATFDSAAVSVQVWPLITRREVQIGTVTLEGLAVDLVELADGRANWTFDASSAEEEPVAADSDAPIGPLTIEGLAIRNGVVTYTDRTGSAYAARDIVLDTGAIGGDGPVPVTLTLSARDESDGTTAALELNAGLQLAQPSVRLEAPRLQVDATGAALPAGEVRAEIAATALVYDTSTGAANAAGLDAGVQLPGVTIQLSGDAGFENDALAASGSFAIRDGDLRRLLAALPDAGYEPARPDALGRLVGTGRWALTASSASLSELSLELDDSSITGDVAVTSFETGAATLDLELDQLDVDAYLPAEVPGAGTAGAAAEPTVVPFDVLRELPVNARLRIGQLRASGMELAALEAKLDNDGNSTSIAADARAFGGHVQLTGSGSPAGADPSLAGRLELDNVSPRAALTALGEAPDTADPAALTRLSGAAAWRLRSRSLDLSNLSWQLDATQLTGSLGVNDFDAPSVRFELALDRMDLDRYLAPEDEDAESEDGEGVEIPADVIRDLNMDGRLTAGALSVMKLQLENLDARVSAADGVLRLEPLRAELYGGTYRGSITIDATGPKSQVSLDQELDAVQVGELLASLIGTERIAGALSLNLRGTGVGNTQSELLKALGGDFAFSLSEGVYRGMDIAWEIQNAQALFKRAAPPERPNRKETPVRALSFSGRMIDGVLGSDSLSAEIPHLKLGGRGGVNLLARTLDYRLNAQVLKSAENDPDSRFRGLAGSIIPLTITGPMSEPKVGVDLQGLIVETVRERARDALFDRLGIGPAEPTAPAPADSGAVPESPLPPADTAGTDAAGGSASAGASATETPEAQAESTEAKPEAEGDAGALEEEGDAMAPKEESDDATPEELIKRSLRDLLKRPDTSG